MNHIMISYSRKDEGFAERIERDLTAEGHRIWRDTNSIPGSADWDIAIQHGIDSSSLVIVVVSGESIKSKWVRRELIYAETQSKPILPLLIEQITLPPILVTTNYISFLKDYTQSFAELCRQLVRILPSQTAQAEAPFRTVTEDPNPEQVRGVSLREFRQWLVDTADKALQQ